MKQLFNDGTIPLTIMILSIILATLLSASISSILQAGLKGKKSWYWEIMTLILVVIIYSISINFTALLIGID